jgi:hypothetical protein
MRRGRGDVPFSQIVVPDSAIDTDPLRPLRNLRVLCGEPDLHADVMTTTI